MPLRPQELQRLPDNSSPLAQYTYKISVSSSKWFWSGRICSSCKVRISTHKFINVVEDLRSACCWSISKLISEIRKVYFLVYFCTPTSLVSDFVYLELPDFHIAVLSKKSVISKSFVFLFHFVLILVTIKLHTSLYPATYCRQSSWKFQKTLKVGQTQTREVLGKIVGRSLKRLAASDSAWIYLW